MNDELSLIRAIWEDRENDTPRLIYADWLEENAGRPSVRTRNDADQETRNIERAEFIRIQCELARSPHYKTPERIRLEKREQALLKKYQTTWRGKLPRPIVAGEVLFRRGFIHFRDSSAEALLHQETRNWWEQYGHLVECVWLANIEGRHFDELFDSEILNSVCELDCYDSEIDEVTLSQFGSLEQLRTLGVHSSLEEDLGGGDFNALANCPQLHELVLHSPENMADEDMEFLAHLPKLRKFTIDGESSINGAGFEFVANKEGLKELHVETDLTIKGCSALGGLVGLESLTLECDTLADSVVRNLSGCSKLRNLVLDLEPTKKGLAQLAKLPRLRRLRLLNFNNQPYKENPFAVIQAPQLEELELPHFEIDPDDYGVLTRFPNLQRLQLGKTVEGEALNYIARLTELRFLELTGSHLTAKSMKPLLALEKLETAILYSCRISDAGLRCLGELPNLKLVDFGHSRVSARGLADLRKRTGLCVLHAVE